MIGIVYFVKDTEVDPMLYGTYNLYYYFQTLALTHSAKLTYHTLPLNSINQANN